MILLSRSGMNDWKRHDEKRKRYGRDIGSKAAFPMLPYPKGAAFTIKQVAYLHAYCGKAPVYRPGFLGRSGQGNRPPP
jgi:hypothetical protein